MLCAARRVLPCSHGSHFCSQKPSKFVPASREVYRTARKFSQCCALLTEFSSKTRKYLVRHAGTSGNFFPQVWEQAGTCGNSFPQFWNMLEPAEIPSRSLETYQNRRKFVPAVWRHAGTGGNLFPQFGGMLELAEICSRRFGIRWNQWKFVRAVWEHAETGGNCRSATHCLPIFLRKLARAFWKSTKTRSLYSLHKQSPRVCGRKSHIKRRSVKDTSVYFLRGVDFPALRSNLRFRASCTTASAEFLRSLI